MKPVKYWYKFYCGECPVCGKDKSYKQRQYGPKPKNPSKRYIEIGSFDTYDWCNL